MRTVAVAAIVLGVLGAGIAGAGETLRLKGSDTIGGKLTPELAEAFRSEYGSSVGFVIEALGSSTAFVGLFDGSADLGASSRPINERETETARSLGVALREVVIAYDGVAVIVHPDNPVRELSVAQLSLLFSGKVRSWKGVGGPDRPVRLISRPSYSGTHAFFKEKALRRGNARGPEEFAASTEWMEENGAIVSTVKADPNAVSYVGLGWVSSGVKALAIVARPGEPPVPPSAESVRTGRYPLYRPLLMYAPPAPREQALQFLRFVFSEPGRRIVEANGFVPPDAGAPLPPFLATVQMPAPLRAVSQAVAEPMPVVGPAESAPASRPDPSSAQVPANRSRPEVVRVYFPFGAMTLGAEAMATLQGVAARLKAGGIDVVLVGHADARGLHEANHKVALARAHAVAAYLRSQGIDGRLFRVEGAGADTPVASNETPAGRAKNRRVDIELLPADR